MAVVWTVDCPIPHYYYYCMSTCCRRHGFRLGVIPANSPGEYPGEGERSVSKFWPNMDEGLPNPGTGRPKQSMEGVPGSSVSVKDRSYVI